ncbi:MAG: nitrate- and nitrite sensing domain-containing protein [Pseudomonadota bacterium]|mgnify:FL=1|jgi:AmiR/NasT family two-component response regulator|uniref:nitrate- and nitrite sensing domain-containing protein n=1 Tax=Alteromonas abrolhosensis TaxID=1892904 RepID=UPI001445B022|nr:nitrate- and nitrite sensing domain-containing protein [Pseudomonadota bacterium]NKW88428.1 ANTAR domain-containing protein [Alteromonadaceae bacterium A_SAG4]NKX05366.1 ANTAR domain-containing protein [Alteromonadaceae bacterium A_SAG6]NKX34687.1 ANTAR domain-containing protein [Alteromonadaceae bacterium A_SAG3]
MLHEPEPTIALCSDATKRFLLAAKHAEITVLEQLSSNCRIVIAVRELIHELQKERGASNIFLASKGERYSSERMQYVSASEQAESTLKSHLKSLYLTDEITSGNPRLLSSITLAMQATDYLPRLREQVSKQMLTPLESTRAYSRLVASLLTVIFEAADIASDPTITRLLVALFNFIQAKEYAGQERAWGAIGFAETHFDVRLCEKLAALQQAQEHHFGIFCEFSCKAQRDALESLNKSPAAIDITQLRNMIAQLSDGSPIASEISEVWFDVATRRIDAMQDIEVALTETLTQQTNTKVANAKNEMANHQQLLTRFNDEHTTDGSPLTLLFDPSMPGLAEDTKEDEIKTLSLNEQTKTLSAHRSFYDLLRSQAQHIEDMERELEEAKRAIQEQKLIGRAKLVIMEQFGLSENSAYRRLQKQAMSENTTIAIIASKIVNIATKSVTRK